uniref:Uncharacterized protein n=1 Tax=Mustela putorius furo TaxID=9669 RepID=M3XTF9_MUSPF
MSRKRSRSDGYSTSSKAACRDGSILASPPSGPTSLVSKAQSILATKTISFPAQRLIRCKRAATCNEPSPTTLEPTASAPGLAVAAHVRGTVSHAGPNSHHPVAPQLHGAVPLLGPRASTPAHQLAPQCLPPSAWGFQSHPQFWGEEMMLRISAPDWGHSASQQQREGPQVALNDPGQAWA